jgi:cellulose synthase/poly-beta-1,6-N-acetylglucosamine synthase-like glycosyltransferase
MSTVSSGWKAVEAAAPEKLIHRSVHDLRERFPDMSASRTLSQGQVVFLLAAAVALTIGLVSAPLPMLIGLNALGTALYLVVFIHGLLWFGDMVRRPALVTVSDEEALAIPESQLPTYTVMVAAYHEANVIGQCIRALEQLDYPKARLEVRLLLEADDRATIEAARATPHGPNLQIVEVPVAMPRTKPKACNYGLQLSGGEVVTIYDAEDRPEPLQLRRAAVALRRLGPEVACLQAKLHHHNVEENFITRSFGAEYLSWFAFMLPALASAGGPVPLGGTSMHVRRDALERVGAWDPNNVTEDADLGVRLQRLGYRTEVLDSVTLEEANSDFVNWVKQRSRWYKGYLQTWLVHVRHPVRLWRELGTRAFVAFNVVVGGTPILAALNPVFWLLAVLWLVARPQVLQTLFPAWLYYPAMACLLGGNFLAVYRTVVGVRAFGRLDLLGAALCSPLYWVMMSIAAIRAIAELTVKPSHWEKTVHGLGSTAREAVQHA